MIRLLAFDIDGTITDGTTWWGSESVGWIQRYSTRDGEALSRLNRAGVLTVPLSRNTTLSARKRIEHLGLSVQWVGVEDKVLALEELSGHFGIAMEEIAYVGDGEEDVALFERVGRSYAVADAHPKARQCATVVLSAPGGRHVIEEVERLLQPL